MSGKWVHRLSDIDTTSRTGLCANCGSVALHYRNPVKPGGRERWSCKEAELEWKRNDPNSGGERGSIRRKRYDSLVQIQGSGCAICGVESEEDRGLVIDHDHDCCGYGELCTNCIRGLLCRTCNLGLGFFSDNPVLLQQAIIYLRGDHRVANVQKLSK